LSLYSITLPYHCHFTSNERDNCRSTKRIALGFAASPVIAVQLIGAAYFQAADGLKGVIANAK
jgi:hypothetical protein